MTLGQIFDKAEELSDLENAVRHDAEEMAPEVLAEKKQRIKDLRALELGAPLRERPAAGLPTGSELTP